MRTVDPVKWFNKKAKRNRVPQANKMLHQNAECLEMRLRASFCDSMREYAENFSVRGLKRAFDVNLSKLERWHHGAVYAACLLWGLGVVSYRSYLLLTSPQLQINLHSMQHSIHRVPFPAVAICSASVIARKSLINYTSFLNSRDRNRTYDTESIMENLVQFGSLQTMDLPNVDVEFMQFLARVDPGFDVKRLMRMFSSPCDAMLSRCSWRGRLLPCDLIFFKRATPLGFCCVFNSRYYSEDAHLSPRYLDMVGEDYGLTVLFHENPDEFAYTRRASVGADILLFDGEEYPILESGGVHMYPVELNTSMYMRVSATSQSPRGHSVPGCRARPSETAEGRSYAWCLTHCRRRTLAALCSCLLHTMPPDDEEFFPICSLTDLPCLNKHKEKFIYYYPGGSDLALEEEVQNGHDCSECAPDCARRLYSAATSVARYHHRFQHKYFRRKILEDKSTVNATVIRLFYTSEHQKLFSVEAYSNWYQSFASLSSSWSCVTGDTMVAACEACFYFTVRWAHHFVRRTRMARQNKIRPLR